MLYSIHFATKELTHLSLLQLVIVLSEHFAQVGINNEVIAITDSITGELFEVIKDEQLTFNYQFYSEKLNQHYTIFQLLEILPYL